MKFNNNIAKENCFSLDSMIHNYLSVYLLKSFLLFK